MRRRNAKKSPLVRAQEASMIFVHLVIGVALLEFLYFGFAVGRARETYGIKAPATTGNEMFERYYRVQMNTLEQLIIFIPASSCSRATSSRALPQCSGSSS
jgi:hypothetical protein